MTAEGLSVVRTLLQEGLEQGLFAANEYEFSESYPLSHLTSFRTGGPAAVIFPTSVRVIQFLLPRLREKKLAYFVLGSGSNTLARDEGYEGLILCLTRMKSLSVQGNRIEAACGYPVTSLAVAAKKAGLGGMEFFYGIPGSVGGAVFMNAGAYGGECKDVLESVTFLTPEGEIRTLPTEALQMGYRTSIFERNDAVILSASFLLQHGSEKEIAEKMEDLMQRRLDKQPLEYPSAGSTFKRCEGRFTGKMIEDAGLKGRRVGGAMVSEKHAGFLINYDNAKSEDILTLARQVQEIILEKEGVSIELEIRVL